MPDYVVLLSVPGLREKDLAHMPRLAALTAGGDRAPIAASFPAVTCPVQVNMTTGVPPEEHGVIANGFYWRDGLTPGRGPKTDGVEMWTAWDDVVQQPRIWDRLREQNPELTSAVWFPLLAKGCGAEYVATFAPIHNPDGSESLWCYTKPEGMYGELRDALGHFPLKHFWGPLAGLRAPGGLLTRCFGFWSGSSLGSLTFTCRIWIMRRRSSVLIRRKRWRLARYWTKNWGGCSLASASG